MRGGEAFIKKYWYPPGCDFEGPLVLPLYRLHGLPVVLHRYPVFRINITQVPVYTHSIRITLHQPSKVFHGSVDIKHSHRIEKITSENIFRHYNSICVVCKKCIISRSSPLNYKNKINIYT